MSRVKVVVEKTRDEVGKWKQGQIEVKNLRKTTAAWQACRSSCRKSTQVMKKRNGGCYCLAFEEARCGVFIYSVIIWFCPHFISIFPLPFRSHDLFVT